MRGSRVLLSQCCGIWGMKHPQHPRTPGISPQHLMGRRNPAGTQRCGLIPFGLGCPRPRWCPMGAALPRGRSSSGTSENHIKLIGSQFSANKEKAGDIYLAE